MMNTVRHQLKDHSYSFIFLLFTVLSIVLLSFFLFSSYRQTSDIIKISTENEAHVLASRMDSVLRRIRASSELINENIIQETLIGSIDPAHVARINKRLDALSRYFPEIFGYIFFDAEGQALFWSHEKFAKVSIADQRYFLQIKEQHRRGDIYFTETITDEAAQTRTITVCQPLLDSKEQWLGMVSTPIDLHFFENLFAKMNVGTQGMVSMRRSDTSQLVVRWPHVESGLNREARDIPPQLQIQAGREEGVVRYVGRTDGVDRIFAFHKTPNFPFYVLVGRAVSEQFAGWTRMAILTSLGTGAGILLIGLFLNRLKKTSRKLQQSANQFQAIAESQHDAVCRWLPDTTLTYVNSKYNELYCGEHETLLGCQWIEFLPQNHRESVQKRYARLAQSPETVTTENRKRLHDGTIAYFHWVTIPLFDAEGRCVEFQSVGRDISEIKRAEVALRESKAQLQAIADTAIDAIITLDPAGRVAHWNPAAEQLFGYTKEEIIGKNLHLLLAPARSQQTHDNAFAVFQKSGQGELVHKTIEVEARHKNGHEISIELSLAALEHEDGWHATGIARDITERKRAEIKLKESEERFKALHNASFGGICIHSHEVIVDCNQGMSDITGYSYAELIGMHILQLFAPAWHALVREKVGAQSEHPYEGEGLRKDGSLYPLSIRGKNIPYKGQVARITEFSDITERKQMEEALRDSEASVRKKLEAILDPEGDVGSLELADIIDIPAMQTMIERVYQFTANSGGVAIVDIHGNVLVAVGWQDICTKFHRIHPETRKNCNESDILLSGGIPAGSSKAYRCKNNLWDIATPIIIGGKHLGNVFVGQFFYEDEVIDYELFRQQARQYGFDEEHYLAALDRIPRWSRKSAEAAMSFYGSLAEMISSLSFGTIQQARILSQKNAALQQLAASKAFQASLIDTIPVPVFYKDLQGRYLGFNKAFEEFFGKTKEYLVGKRVFDLYPAEFAQIYSARDDELFNQQATQVYEDKLPDAQGHWHDIIFHKASLVDAQGGIVGLIGAMLDITDRNRTEEEKKVLQRQLLQAHKMEAIGTLAGGIAHDFNNILGAIIGYAELAKELLPPDSVASLHLDKVLTASQRASNLVKQILAFSRQSEIERIPVKLAHIVEEVLKLIRPSLPATITIKQSVDAHVRSILADPTQVHQILMNLCTNAFHAMELAGGTLEITLKNYALAAEDLVDRPAIQPGNFVELTVSDTGIGVDPEILNKIFDPFFTTKEVGKGTGMGLANCHGIVAGYGGFITCESRLGQGTIFRIFFPAIEEKEGIEAKAIASTPSGSGRILLVDDEEILVEMGKTMLERLGYEVVTRSNSLDALATFQNQPQAFDIIITDQTMPGMTGVDLARKILQTRPGMPIILCTGYSSTMNEEHARHYGIKGFVMKPYTKQALASVLRQVLDQE